MHMHEILLQISIIKWVLKFYQIYIIYIYCLYIWKYKIAINKIITILFVVDEKIIIEIVIHEILNFNLSNHYLICIIIIIINQWLYFFMVFLFF